MLPEILRLAHRSPQTLCEKSKETIKPVFLYFKLSDFRELLLSNSFTPHDVKTVEALFYCLFSQVLLLQLFITKNSLRCEICICCHICF